MKTGRGSIKELRELIEAGWEAHEKRLVDFDRQLEQQRIEHRQRMNELDERILNLVSAIGDLPHRPATGIREVRGGQEKA